MPNTIAILGWGSLIWDDQHEFNGQIGAWQHPGPTLRLEFSRISTSRSGALTLVIDDQNGSPCSVAYSISNRESTDLAIEDLMHREQTTLKNIGILSRDRDTNRSRSSAAKSAIQSWMSSTGIDAAIWTDLPSNYSIKSKNGNKFSVSEAISYLHELPIDAQLEAFKYMHKAPDFIKTPLRTACQSQDWYQHMNEDRT